MALAAWLLAGVRTLEIPEVPRAEASLNGWAMAVALGVLALTAALIALLPAMHAPRTPLVPALRDGERGVTGTRGQLRLRNLLVASEVALSLTLLIGAGLLLRSLEAVLRVDWGFQTEDRVLMSLNMPVLPQDDKGARAASFLQDVLEGVADIPGVRSAAAVSTRPLSPGSTGLGVATPEQPNPEEVPWASWRLVTSDYFRTLGVPLLRGRVFTDRDRVDQTITVVISERLAELLWPGRDPIGQGIILWKGQGDRQGLVVGVVGDMRERGLAGDPTLAVYMPYYGVDWSPAQLVVHTTLAPGALVPLVRQVVGRVDKAAPVADPQTFDAIVFASVGERRLVAGLLAGFAGVALLLSLVGIGIRRAQLHGLAEDRGNRRAHGARRDDDERAPAGGVAGASTRRRGPGRRAGGGAAAVAVDGGPALRRHADRPADLRRAHRADDARRHPGMRGPRPSGVARQRHQRSENGLTTELT